MIPSNTFKVVGSSQVRGTIERSRIEADNFYPISGAALHELLVLAVRFNHRLDDPNETRDWQNRLNGMVAAVRDTGPLT